MLKKLNLAHRIEEHTVSIIKLNFCAPSQTVVDFFSLNAHNLSTLHFVEVEDLHIDDLQLTGGECVNLERFVMQACCSTTYYIDIRVVVVMKNVISYQHQAQTINFDEDRMRSRYFCDLLKDLEKIPRSRSDQASRK